MKVLVTAATKHGATAEIAAAIGEVLGGEPGLDAAVIPPEQVATIDGYDAVVLGSAVYAGHWLATAAQPSFTVAYQTRSAASVRVSLMRETRRYNSRRPMTSRRSWTSSSADAAWR